MKTTKLTMIIGLMAVLAVGSGSGWAQARRADDGPTIGPSNGISYQVIGTHLLTRMDAGRCGYHDLSLPNDAVFSVESRLYHEYDHGRLLRTWSANVEAFVRCYEP